MLKLLRLVEKGSKCDDGGVDKKTSRQRHPHGGGVDDAVVCEHDGNGQAADDHESRRESSEINDCAARLAHKVILTCPALADGIWCGGETEDSNDNQWQPVVPQCTGEND